MKICVVSTPVFKLIPPMGVSGYGGLEPLAWLIAKGLAAKGHQVSLVAPDGSECPGVEMIHVGPERQVDENVAHDKCWKHLIASEVVIDHTWSKKSYLLKMERKADGTAALQAPVLGVCHAPINTMYQTLPAVDKPCFVCISQDQKAHFDSLFGPRQARYVYNGVDGENFYKPIGLPRSKRYLFLARFSKIKGAYLAIQACKEAGVGLDLIGDTTITNEPEYFAKCRAMVDGKQIRMIGNVTRGNTAWWHSQAHCLLHPNEIFREPFGLSPVESFCCGTPCIAWDYGAMRETIKPGVSGFLVNSYEEMVKLIKDDAASTIDRNACREWGRQFSVERMVNSYEELCEEALATGGW